MYFFIFINFKNNDFVIDNFLLEVNIYLLYFVDIFFFIKIDDIFYVF